MQQLPIAFLSIALGGKSPAMDRLGKSLSNDDFGQILGSIKAGDEDAWQGLVERLSPEQLTRLAEYDGKGTTLPEAASIYLHQLRQAAGVPVEPVRPAAKAAAPPGELEAAPHPGGLPWPFSQVPAGGPAAATPGPVEGDLHAPGTVSNADAGDPLTAAASVSGAAAGAAVMSDAPWSTGPGEPAPPVTRPATPGRPPAGGVLPPGWSATGAADLAAPSGPGLPVVDAIPVRPGDAPLPAETPLAASLRRLLRPAVDGSAGAAAQGPESSPASRPRPGESIFAALLAATSRPGDMRPGAPGRGPHGLTQALAEAAGGLASVTAEAASRSGGSVLETLPANDRTVTGLGGLAGLAGLAEAQAAGPARPGAVPLPELSLPQRLTEPGWAQALGERLVLMAGREQQSAEIRLNPPHLGPLEVRLSLHQDQASVSFLAQHAPVREALEQAIPRLREMFQQQDLQLVNVDVGQRREQPAGGEHGGRRPAHFMDGGVRAGDEPAPAVSIALGTRSGVSEAGLDLYA